MSAVTCRCCHSTKRRKNGRTRRGQQQMHCKDCTSYGTLETQDATRAHCRALAAQLATERLSLRAIARTLKLRWRTITTVLQKKV